MKLRTDLFVTTATRETPALWTQALSLSHELHCPAISRNHGGMPALFALYPEAQRAIIVKTNKLMLVDRAANEFFYHPNMAYLRYGNLVKGGNDSLLDATSAKPGDTVLDCTLGYAAEATLFAYCVGETGEVHGVESIPEIGVVVRAGLKTVRTARPILNDAMRRVEVVYLGPHYEYLTRCPDNRYDIVYFDPFFEHTLTESEPFAPIRLFGDHARLTAETLTEAARVARRVVVVKTMRWSQTFHDLGITERFDSRNGKVSYGIIRIGDNP